MSSAVMRSRFRGFGEAAACALRAGAEISDSSNAVMSVRVYFIVQSLVEAVIYLSP